MTVGDAFKRFRDYLNLSQTDVANTLGMKQQSYSRFERGETSPRAKDLLTLADTYGVSVDYLLGRSDEPRPRRIDDQDIRDAFKFRDKWLVLLRTASAEGILPQPTTATA